MAKTDRPCRAFNVGCGGTVGDDGVCGTCGAFHPFEAADEEPPDWMIDDHRNRDR
jgi:hypothetical protein